MSQVTLAVITNSFNRLDLMQKAVPSLFDSLGRLTQSTALIVFDAGSADGSPEFVEELILQNPEREIHLVKPQSRETSSFAHGCNQAIAYAGKLFPELKWCLFYETDNLLLNSEALLDAVALLDEQTNVGGVGFTVERLDGRKTGHGCRFPGMLSFAVGQQAAAWLHLDDPLEPHWHRGSRGHRWAFCDVVYTSPLLIRYQAWKDAGAMDSVNFPFTDSDVEWCWRATQKGWPMAVLDVPGVIHDNGGSISNWSGRRVLWFHQSRLRLLRQHFPILSMGLKAMLYLRHSIEILLLLPRSQKCAQARQSLRTRFTLVKCLWNDYEQVLNN